MPQIACFYPEVIAQLATIFLFLFLVYSSTEDIKTRTIPIHLATVCVFYIVADLIASKTPIEILLRLCSTAGVFLLLCLISKLFGLGGGDIIIISLILLKHGIFFAMCSVGIGCALTTIYVILQSIMNKGKLIAQNREYPLVPGITIAYTTLLFAKELSIWHPIL